MSSPVLADASQPLRSPRYGWVGLAIATFLFLCLPWMAHRLSSIGALANAIPQENKDEVPVFGGRRMSGLLVVRDDTPLRSDIASVHLSQFEAIVKLSGVEAYQDLIHPTVPPVPFGFVFAPRVARD